MSTRINVHQEPWPTIPAHRLEAMQARLRDERRAYNTAPAGSIEEDAYRRNVDDLEQAIDRLEQGIRIRTEADRKRVADNAAKTAARQEEAEAQLRAQLRSEFMGGNPDATEADFDRLYPELRDRHMLQRHDEALAAARRRIGRI